MNTESEKNRGYFKIKGAASAFNFDFRNKTVLDIGSSTGGFTEFALEKGAKKVIAVEKGTNQMKSPLRHDPRIDLHEKTDIFNTGISKSIIPGISERGSARVSARAPWRSPLGTRIAKGKRERATRPGVILLDIPDIIVADVSFLSLTKILKYAKIHLARRDTEFLVMLKPQFEAKPDQLNKGVVKNEKIRREIIKNFEKWLKDNDFIIINKRDNTLHGKTGNIERFYLLKLAN